MLGDGVFETLRAYEGQLPFWDLHIERLKSAMSQLGFSLKNISFETIKEQAKELLQNNFLSDAYVRLTISRGDSILELLPDWGTGKPNWVLLTKPLPSQLSINQKRGIKAIISSFRKNNFSPVARFKTINYLELILAKREALLKEAQEAILLDEKGYVTEAATANLFWIQKEILYTPSIELPILPGITRKKIQDIINDLGIPSKEGRYKHEKLINSKEAFLTNSICEVTPISIVNGISIGDGRPGPITQRLQKEYKELIKKIYLVNSAHS